MAPIPSFDHLTLALRALDPDRHQAGNQKPPKEYTQQERERAGILMACIIGAVILGVIIAYIYAKIKEVYGERIKSYLEARHHRKYAKRYEKAARQKVISEKANGNAAKKISGPKPAHLARPRADVQEVSEVDRITENLTEAYLKKTTAVMGCLD